MVASGQLVQAETSLAKFLSTNQENAEAATLMGIVYAQSNRPKEASERLEFALRHDPGDAETLLWLAVVRKSQRRTDEAVQLLGEVKVLQPENHEALNLLGLCLIELGRAEEAETTFRSLIKLQPRTAAAYANLGMSLRLQNRGSDALEAFRSAVQMSPEHAGNFFQLFKQYQQLSRWEDAVSTLRSGLATHPGSGLLLEALAVALGRLGQSEEAEKIFQRIAQSSVTGANSYAIWLQEQGRFEDSVPVLHQSLKLQPLQGEPYRNLVEAKQFELNGKPILAKALRVLGDARLEDTARMQLSYAVGKLHDRDGNYEQAMKAFDVANEIAYRTYPACKTFDPGRVAQEPVHIADTYTKNLIEEFRSRSIVQPGPIFIIGMIRSGTTLLDQIVSSHPNVTSVGEGTFWNVEADAIHSRWRHSPLSQWEIEDLADRYRASVGQPKGLVTDKMPLNYRHLGLIHLVFPEARILHIRRNPFDTCLSIYMTFFAGGPNFAYNQENIVAFYHSYLGYMRHWRQTLGQEVFYELDYEELVTNPESSTRSAIEFLGLPWDDACLHHDKNSEQVSTPSRWQARQQVYTTSTGKAGKYGKYCGALSQLTISL